MTSATVGDTPTRPLALPPRPRRRRRRARRWLAGIAALGVAAGVAVWVSTRGAPATPVSSACTVSGAVTTAANAAVGGAAPAAGPTFQLSPAQGQNAAIIAATAVRLGLPDHAVTIALATALQESKLQNLDYGDRDSVGLFQQRPSEGWGTATQILDPVYAATAFYNRLQQVPGWETMAVTDAAQAVQASAAGDAYAQWEPEARALAVALTGEAPAGFTCRLVGFAGPAPSPSALATAATAQFGANVIGAPLPTKEGWAVASWAVAHAWQYHLQQVRYGGREWTPQTGQWRPVASAASTTVEITPA